nr:hypothetical protein [uncultured Holophaga sp.]
MATVSKIAGNTTSAPGTGLEARLSEALEILHSGQEARAQELLQALGEEASQAGGLLIARRVRTTLAALGRRASTTSRVVPASREMEIQVLLNQGSAKEALPHLDAVLAAESGRAGLHYLKALALAQLGDAEGAASALKQAVSLDGSFLHQYHMEKDFDGVRSAGCFAELELL